MSRTLKGTTLCQTSTYRERSSWSVAPIEHAMLQVSTLPLTRSAAVGQTVPAFARLNGRTWQFRRDVCDHYCAFVRRPCQPCWWNLTGVRHLHCHVSHVSDPLHSGSATADRNAGGSATYVCYASGCGFVNAPRVPSASQTVNETPWLARHCVGVAFCCCAWRCRSS